jgi:nucleoside-diphosphate-sugar epimerase
MRILMTGGTGLIGRELGKALAARGVTLVCRVRDVGAARRRLPFPAVWHAWNHADITPPGEGAVRAVAPHARLHPDGDRGWHADARHRSLPPARGTYRCTNSIGRKTRACEWPQPANSWSRVLRD